ncbi:hypothetical protein FQR65_LT04518 [Abscondita terminalis]|nr:hypothetical protein FQR65_LT04518 [Abscondita terminalis]
MGILTDPSAGQGKITKAIVNYHSKLSVLFYISGIIWFCCLAYAPLNAGTHFSENALLPGLVKSEFRDDGSARSFYEELQHEMRQYDNSIPYPWILAKFQQIGLGTYTHNFTLNYPLGKSNIKYNGKNVYGILRAARAGSTEALVMSVPYRPPTNINPTTAPAVAIMLAFAKHANKQKYWSKDIIFLITEHEQLGIQAWLEAYFNVVCGRRGVLDHGDLRGRGGAIQAAINLEFHDVLIDRMDIKVEGLNGQLPNLDLFNLATRMCSKEGVSHTFKNRDNRNYRDPLKEWNYSFQTLMNMVFTQASGVPNGNHGLFHRFGIQALTLEGFSDRKTHSHQGNFLVVGRILESIFRSLNNLLERFHQSYFFYLLPSSDRFVSIGLYMPSICLIAGALFLKAAGKWFKFYQYLINLSEMSADDKKKLKNSESADADINLIYICGVLLFTHTLGILLMNSPKLITSVGAQHGLNTELSLFGGFALIFVLLLIIPMGVTIKSCYKSMTVLHVISLLEAATTLICLSMYNFSLGLILGTLYVPVLLSIESCRSKIYSITQKLLWMLVHPFVMLTIAVLVYTYFSFPNESLTENIFRGISATQQAIAFGIVDFMIYSNWLYGVVTCCNMWKELLILLIFISGFIVQFTSSSCVVVPTIYSYRSLTATCTNNTKSIPDLNGTVTILDCLDCNIPSLDQTTIRIKFVGSTFKMMNSHVRKIKQGAFETFRNDINGFIFTDNEIDYIEPKVFSSFNNLEEINFRNNKISSLEKDTFKGTNLTTLDLSINKISNITILDGLKVCKLNLSGNAIMELSEHVFDNVMFWTGRGGHSVPILDLSNNFIEKLISISIKFEKKANALKYLYIDTNLISRIENDTFLELCNLYVLSLKENKITILYENSFRGLTSLTSLLLNKNKITDIPLGLFGNLRRLESLDLSENRLLSLSTDTFSGLQYLHKLNISHNNLRVLDDTCLIPLGKLFSLDVSNNKLHEMNLEKILDHHFRLRVLALNDNFWTCKDLVHMYKLKNRKSGGFDYSTQHFGVPNLHGIACSREVLTSYDNLSFEEFLNIISEDDSLKTFLTFKKITIRGFLDTI